MYIRHYGPANEQQRWGGSPPLSDSDILRWRKNGAEVHTRVVRALLVALGINY